MSTTILHAGGVITPRLVDGWTGTRDAGSIVHDILGRAVPDVTLRPAGTRSGTLRLIFIDETAAADAEAVLSSAAVFTLASDERATIGGDFVVQDRVERELDDGTRNVWIVSAGYRAL